MAKSPKSETEKTKIDEAIEVEAEVSEVEEIIEDADEIVEGEALDADAEVDAEIDETVDADALDGDVVVETVVEETVVEMTAPVEQNVAPETSSGGFFPLLMGGVVAGAIGYGVATYFQPEDETAALTAKIEDQSAAIEALQARLNDLPAPDTSGLEAQIADVSSDLGAQLAGLEDRVAQVERQPNADGTLSETALAAYRAELDELQTKLLSAATQAGDDLAAARAEAERLEQEALEAAEAAKARAAINRVATAVETGAPFADALADLDDVPAALSDAAETGVATNAQLTADFSAVARAALATARAEGASDDASGLGGFLRSQFDVRSTTPQDGPGPDAVLSRAEAAVKEGRMADALAEIEALPEVARAEMTDWTAQAQERADVLAAIASLSETYQ